MAQQKKGLGRIPSSLSWLEEYEREAASQSEAEHDTVQRGAQEGLEPGWTRATFIIDKQLHETIKAYAYWQRVTVKEVVDAALQTYFADKDVEPLPERTRTARNRLLE